MSPSPTATVVVPCFNESTRLDGPRFAALAARAATSVLLVDDGSTDDTRQVITALADENPGIDVLALDANGGKGEAIRRGLLHALDAGAARVGYLDADLATPPEEYERLLSELDAQGVDGIIGARVGLLGWAVSRSPVRHYLGRVFATLASQAVQLGVYDTQCGAKVFRDAPALRSALARPFLSRWVFDIELLGRMAAADPSVRFVEIPLREWVDVGASRLDPVGMARAFADLGRVAVDLRRVRRQGV